MTQTHDDEPSPSPSPAAVGEPAAARARPQSMKRVAAASYIGSVIEFYDFNIYGVAAALVFPAVFFPALGVAAGTVASLATFGVAFLARPIGSIVFGHLGDRLGRKNTLVATLLLMGIATVLVGLMPTPATIGAAAPVLLVILRFCQGFAAGGEWAGAVLFASEYAPKPRRGIWSVMPSMGGASATILANATFLTTAVFIPTDVFVSWGWRIPFLVSALLVVVGLWIRLGIAETPVFRRLVKTAEVARLPFAEVWRNQPRQVLLAMGSAVLAFSLAHVSATYLINYGTATVKLPQPYVLGMPGRTPPAW